MTTPGNFMYDIEYTPQAVADLKWFKKHEQKQILDGIEVHLRYEPNVENRNRKPMRPNKIATWELRLRECRVLYDIDEQIMIVDIQRIGEKQRNAFLFRGKQEDV